MLAPLILLTAAAALPAPAASNAHRAIPILALASVRIVRAAPVTAATALPQRGPDRAGRAIQRVDGGIRVDFY